MLSFSSSWRLILEARKNIEGKAQQEFLRAKKWENKVKRGVMGFLKEKKNSFLNLPLKRLQSFS